MSITRLIAPAPALWPVMGDSPVVRMQFFQVGVISMPPDRFPRVRPTPCESLYTSKFDLPRLSLVSCNSSKHKGKWFRNAAVFSQPTAVASNVLIYSPIAGLPQTEAASISATVLPVPLSMPHRCTKNGRHPSGSKRTDANEAAKIIRAVTDIFLHSSATLNHSVSLPLLVTALYKLL